MSIKATVSILFFFIGLHFLVAQEWIETDIVAPDLHPDLVADFANNMIVYKDFLLVSAPRALNGKYSSGSAALYEYQSGRWIQKTRLYSEELYSEDSYIRGFSLGMAMNDSIIVIGAPESNLNDLHMVGTVHVFTRSSNDWSAFKQYTIYPSDTISSRRFGASLHLEGMKLFVSSGAHGNVFVYELGASEAILKASLRSSLSLNIVWGNSRQFGQSIKANKNYLFVSAPGDEMGECPDGGGIYVYDKNNDWEGKIEQDYALFHDCEEIRFALGTHFDVNEKYLISYVRDLYNGEKLDVLVYDLSELTTGDPNQPSNIYSIPLEKPFSVVEIKFLSTNQFLMTYDNDDRYKTLNFFINDEGRIELIGEVTTQITNPLFGQKIEVHNQQILNGSQNKILVYEKPEINQNPPLAIVDTITTPYYTTVNTNFGRVIAQSDSYVFAGSPYEGDVFSNQGMVYIYKILGDSLSLIRKLHPPNPVSNGIFGYSIDVHENHLSVGAPGSGGNDGVYMYTYEDTELKWEGSLRTELIKPETSTEGEVFGNSVDLHHNEMIMVGFLGHNSPSYERTTVIYHLENGRWVEKYKTQIASRGGGEVGADIYGNYAVSSGSSGADLHVFKRNGDNWKIVKELSNSTDFYCAPSLLQINERFLYAPATYSKDLRIYNLLNIHDGVPEIMVNTPFQIEPWDNSFDINSDVLAIGNHNRDIIYLYSYDGLGYTLADSIVKNEMMDFGYGVSLRENTLIAGAPNKNLPTGNWSGQLSLYKRSNSIPDTPITVDSIHGVSDYYGIGDTLLIYVAFTDTVFAENDPFLILGDNNEMKASYKSGSGSSILTFELVVEEGIKMDPLEINNSFAMLHHGKIYNLNNPVNRILPDPYSQNSLSISKIIVDGVSPVPELISVGTAVNGIFEIVISFHEPIEGFDESDLVVENAEIQEIEMIGDSAKLVVLPGAEGEMQFWIRPDSYFDLSGNSNLGSDTLKVIYDITPPELFFTAPQTIVTNFDVQYSFSEPIKEIKNSGFGLENGMFLEQSATPGRLTVDPLDSGWVKIWIEQNSFRDFAGNWNIKSDTVWVYNDTIPAQLFQYNWPTHKLEGQVNIPKLVDLDNDGDLDLFVLQNYPVIFENNGTNFIEKSRLVNETGFSPNISWVDLNHDGLLDAFVYSNSVPYDATVLINLGNFEFERISLWEISSPQVDPQYAWGDIDNDGDWDLIGNFKPPSSDEVAVRVIKNENGTLTSTRNHYQGRINSRQPFADFNNDGFLDIALVIGEECNAKLLLLLNDLGNHFKKYETVINVPDGDNAEIVWVNINGDHLMDIASIGNNPCGVGGNFKCYVNKGDNVLEYKSSLITKKFTSRPVFLSADLDNNGEVDQILYGIDESNTETRIFLQSQPDPSHRLSGGLANGSMDIGDIDNDNDLDIVVVSGRVNEQSNLIIYENRFNISHYNTPPTRPEQLTTSLSGNTAKISWKPSTDDHSNVLYNLQVLKDGIPLRASSLDSGIPKLVLFRDAFLKNEFHLTIEEGSYYQWSVQAIDESWNASEFAPFEEISSPLEANEIGEPRFYPNPVTKDLMIKSNSEILNVEIQSLTGEIIQIIRLLDNKASIDLSDLPNGMFILKLETRNGKKLTYKLIKKS
ncbi:T9SS type A sorting domain-containing protein [Marinoscillum sp. 108]|uniref:T9SS type A sorting domain-containing protein n=1 Tax=Marinoscillum sp. 108 TaxID=2653151 RepID=UPI0012EEE9D6|nr:T9SS type A sorting domain-containing protein [Marinoscillum sp. 108]VXD12327.1 hypothetical protein MARINOS108_10983 [Marinoscillum sp. 108]